MSGVTNGMVGAGAIGAGAAAGKSALLPFTGVAVGVYLAFALCLLVAGFALRHIAARRG
ncbi:MAG: hypothetical protein ACRDLB_10535 [Actinomycetota bacterium]